MMRCQSPLEVRWCSPQTCPEHRSKCGRQSHLTQRWWPDLSFQTCQPLQPEGMSKVKAVQINPFTSHNLALFDKSLSHELNWPCAGMCLNLQACRSWRRCWLFRCPYLGQTGLWPPGSVSGNPWTADIELIWDDNNKSLKCDMST